MEFLKFLAWLLLNVGVPLLAPIALLPLLFASEKYCGDVKTLIRRSLQDGQLFWAVIAMCATACYEAAGQAANSPSLDTARATMWLALALHVVIIIASSVLVLLGAIDAEGRSTRATGSDGPPRIMVISIWMAAVTAVSFSMTHLWAD